MANVLKEVQLNAQTACDCSKLTEKDIPGSTLPKAPEHCKVADLRIWLKCRGQRVKAKETKAELCVRVKQCPGLGDFSFMDPYPGQPHLEKKRNNCERCRKKEADPVKSVQGNSPLCWTTDATVIPKTFSYLNIVDYSKGSGKLIKDNVEKCINRGYAFFFDGYVHDIRTAAQISKVLVKGKCYRSMKKSESPHSVEITLSKDGEVVTGKCTCVAGASGYCNHVFGLLYQVDHSVKLALKNFTRVKTCTERPSEWIKCRTDGVRAEPVMKAVVVKPRYGSVSLGVKTSLYDARTGSARDGLNLQRTIDTLKEINPLIGLCQTVNSAPKELRSTSLGVCAPVGSVLSYQLSLTEGDFTVEDNTDIELSQVLIVPQTPNFPWQNHRFPSPVDNKLLQQLDLLLSKEEATDLQQKTKEQASCDIWHSARAKRLTASKFGQIINRKKDKVSFVEDHLLKKRDLGTVHAVRYGLDREDVAVKQYVKYMKNTKRPVTVEKCGVVVNPDFPWLAASPDRIVFNKESGFGLLEVKCSYSKRHLSPKDACLDKNFFCEMQDGKFQLKENHMYFSQIQGQMGICGANFCDLIVYTDKGLGIQRVLFDERYWLEMTEKLNVFFVETFAPVLLKRSEKN